MSGKNNKNETTDDKPIVIRNTTDLQRLKLEKLMKNPDKPVLIPERPKGRSMPPVPDFVRNVMGSSAGAGSGEFHVYRHLRRKEYARQKFIQERSEREKQDDEYHDRLEENKRLADLKTAKKRLKRQKQKQRAKQKGKKVKKEESSSESSELDDTDEEKEEVKDDDLINKIKVDSKTLKNENNEEQKDTFTKINKDEERKENENSEEQKDKFTKINDEDFDDNKLKLEEKDKKVDPQNVDELNIEIKQI